jgi:hypothetical protein
VRRGNPVRAVFPAFVLALASLALAPSARADLASEAEELAKRWATAGFRTVRLPPVFLEHGRGRPVRLPDAAYDPGRPSCTTIAFLAGRSTDFVIRIDPFNTLKHHSSGGHAERSVAGAVLISECGAARDAFARLSIELRVARSSIETVIAVGESPAPPIAETLPERASGPAAPLADPGPRGQLEPLAVRARRAEDRAKNGGAMGLRTQSFTAEVDGSGRELVRLEEGCHRIELMAELSGKQPVDLDAELRETTSERLVARDRSDAPDARLELCAGSSMGVDLVFAGAAGPVEVMFLDAVYPLPKGAPTIWGARARAAVSAALWRRKLPPIEDPPIEQRLGVAGLTSIPIPVEPGSCYVAAVGTIRGDPRSVTLTVKVDTRIAFDSNAGLVDGSAVAFCSGGSDRARIEAEIRGSAVAWVLDVWRLGNRAFDEGR